MPHVSGTAPNDSWRKGLHMNSWGIKMFDLAVNSNVWISSVFFPLMKSSKWAVLWDVKAGRRSPHMWRISWHWRCGCGSWVGYMAVLGTRRFTQHEHTFLILFFVGFVLEIAIGWLLNLHWLCIPLHLIYRINNIFLFHSIFSCLQGNWLQWWCEEEESSFLEQAVAAYRIHDEQGWHVL